MGHVSRCGHPGVLSSPQNRTNLRFAKIEMPTHERGRRLVERVQR